jgi:hypothetical protein
MTITGYIAVKLMERRNGLQHINLLVDGRNIVAYRLLVFYQTSNMHFNLSLVIEGANSVSELFFQVLFYP